MASEPKKIHTAHCIGIETQISATMRRGLAARFGSGKRKEAEKKKTATANRIAAERRRVRANAVELVEDELWMIIKFALCAMAWLMLFVFTVSSIPYHRGVSLILRYCSLCRFVIHVHRKDLSHLH